MRNSKGLTVDPAYCGREGRIRLIVGHLSPLVDGKSEREDADEDEGGDEGTNCDKDEDIVDARRRRRHGLPNIHVNSLCHKPRLRKDTDEGPCQGELLDLLGALLADGEDLDGDD